jgi:hypothetical protein
VGDDEQPAGVSRPAALEVLGEPGDRFDVEVVGGLVEQQHLPLAGQQPGERDAPPLAAAEHGHRRVPGDAGEQAADHVAHPGIARPDVLRRVPDDRPLDRERVVERVALVELADPDPAADGDPPGVGLLPPGEHGEQAGLAVTVPTDHADPVAVVQAQGDGIEDDFRRKLKVQGLGPQQMRHIASRLFRAGGCAARRSPGTAAWG